MCSPSKKKKAPQGKKIPQKLGSPAVQDCPLKIPQIDAPVELDFGTIQAGQKPSKTLSVTSSGTGPLVIGAITFPAAHFKEAGDSVLKSGQTLASKAKSDIKIVFDPAEVGDLEAELVIQSDAQNAPSHKVTLSGTLPAKHIEFELLNKEGNVALAKVATLKIKPEGKDLETIDSDDQGKKKLEGLFPRRYDLQEIFLKDLSQQELNAGKIEYAWEVVEATVE